MYPSWLPPSFFQALKIVLCKVVAQSDYVDAWVRLLLFRRCTLQVYRPKNRQERGPENRKSLQQNGSTLGSFGQGGGDFLEEGVTCNTNIKQCLRKVADRQVTAAVKVISSSGVTPYCDDTIKALEGKHPYKPPPSMPSITFSEPPLIAKIDSVFSCIKSFPKGNSCGRDGLRAQHILDALYGEGSATATNLLKVLSEYHNDGSLVMLTVDFSNAFKLVDRSALLHDQVNLLGPLLFALILHLLLHKIKDSCKLLLHAWYLDDGTVIGDSEEIVRVLDIIKVSGPGLGLELNIKKTEIFWTLCNGIKLHEGLFPDDIRRPSSGAKLVGGAVSRDADFISGLAMRGAANAVDFMSLIPQLHNPQSEHLLLRSCMGIAKLFFGLRTCQPIHMEETTLFFDKAKVVSSYAFVASRAQSWVLQDHILRDSGICGMDDDYVSALVCLRDTIPSLDFSCFTNKDIVPSKAQQTLANVLFGEMDFLLAIPIDGLGQHMSLVEYHTILKYRLMIPLFSVDAICPVCRKACLDSFGEHAVHCKELPGFKCRHDMVRDVLFDICRHMEDDVDINALTIEQYIALIPNDIKPGIVNPKIGDDVEFEINANFMRE
ncbi:hypothetical protein Tco_0265793 [Tanacetum coccineum]